MLKVLAPDYIEGKVNSSWIFYGGAIAIVTCLYMLTGSLGRYIAHIPPGNVTPIWPPSGIALGVLLIYGMRLWPGIFLGLFIDFLLIYHDKNFLNVFPAALGISFGGTLQAIAGCYLIKKFTDVNLPFNTPKSSFYFLSLALLSCAINATIGPIMLCLNEFASWDHFFLLWVTWWLGDAFGVIIITPCILLAFKSHIGRFSFKSMLEAVLMTILVLIIENIVFTIKHPLVYGLTLPLIWSAFRFGPITTFFLNSLIMVLAVWYTFNGQGPFVETNINASFLLLDSFIIAITAMTIILQSTITERKEILYLLSHSNIELESKVAEKTKTLFSQNQTLTDTMTQMEKMQHQIIIQEKMASMGAVTAGIAHEIKNPLNFIKNFSEMSLVLIQDLEKYIDKHKAAIPSQDLDVIKESLTLLKEDVDIICEQGKRAGAIIQKMMAQSHAKPDDKALINIHALLDEYIKLSYQGMKLQYPDLQLKIEKDFDRSIEKIEAIPLDIGRVFLNILNNAYYALAQKQKQQGERFIPILTVKTKHSDQNFEIRLRDNGLGISDQVIHKIFSPFFTTKPVGYGTGLGLSLSHNIIVEGHGGTLTFDTKEGEYTEFIITLPIIKKPGNLGLEVVKQ